MPFNAACIDRKKGTAKMNITPVNYGNYRVTTLHNDSVTVLNPQGRSVDFPGGATAWAAKRDSLVKKDRIAEYLATLFA